MTYTREMLYNLFRYGGFNAHEVRGILSGCEYSDDDFWASLTDVINENAELRQEIKSWKEKHMGRDERKAVFMRDGDVTGKEADRMRRAYIINNLPDGEKRVEYMMMYADKKDLTDAMVEKAREVPLHRVYDTKGQKQMRCPFHDDKNPSFSVTGNLWYCHAGCGGGDTIAFVRKLTGSSFHEAVKYVLSK